MALCSGMSPSQAPLEARIASSQVPSASEHMGAQAPLLLSACLQLSPRLPGTWALAHWLPSSAHDGGLGFPVCALSPWRAPPLAWLLGQLTTRLCLLLRSIHRPPARFPQVRSFSAPEAPAPCAPSGPIPSPSLPVVTPSVHLQVTCSPHPLWFLLIQPPKSLVKLIPLVLSCCPVCLHLPPENLF